LAIMILHAFLRRTILVRAVKRASLEIHLNNKQVTLNNRVIIIDVPPGTSCPVIESVKGSDFCLLTTEPTPFGLNDLILAVEVLRKLRIPFGVLINRADVGDIAMAYSKGIPIIEAKPAYKKDFLKLYEKIEELTGD